MIGEWDLAHCRILFTVISQPWMLCCIAGNTIGKRYARTDEIGVPLAITVDNTTSVTVRDRDSKDQIRVEVDEVASVVKEVMDGQSTWADIMWRYPAHTASAADEEEAEP